MKLTLLAAAAYLIGSINFSILLFKFLARGDPRDGGSGNPGATNVKRQLGLAWATLVLFLDLIRAAGLALLAVIFLPPAWWPCVCFCLIVGNRYPVFHNWRGGKGVAAYLGFTLVVWPLAAVLGGLAWLAGYSAFKEPFLGSFFMIGILSLGTLYRLSWSWPAVIMTFLTSGFILFAHQENVRRYRQKRII